MDRLWEVMAQMFGHSWVSQYGDIDGGAYQTWGRGLQRLTVDQIAKGVNATQQWEGSFPPNLGQFIKLCTQLEQKPLDYLAYAQEKMKRLAAPKPDKAKGRQELEQMKKEMGL